MRTKHTDGPLVEIAIQSLFVSLASSSTMVARSAMSPPVIEAIVATFAEIVSVSGCERIDEKSENGDGNVYG